MREGSSSLGALRRALAAAEDAGARTELIDLRKLDLPMYEPGRAVGELAGARSVDTLVHAVHALHGVVAPLTVAIPKSWQRSDAAGNITDDAYGARLEKLGRLVVELAERLSPEREAGRAVGLAS